MKIYTKTGDKGETGIIGARISKASDIIDLIGNLDELNALVGLVVSQLRIKNDELRGKAESSRVQELDSLTKNLEDIESDIFGIGAIVAGGKVKINIEERVKFLEDQIDKMDESLKPLQNFILPGGSLPSAYLHLTRAVCRRAERSAVSLTTDYLTTHDLSTHPSSSLRMTPQIIVYLNRLSDYLFVLARFVNHNLNQKEQIWK